MNSHLIIKLMVLVFSYFLLLPDVVAQEEPSKLDIATAEYKLKGIERSAKLANGAPFSLGKDGTIALEKIAALYKAFPDHPKVKELFNRARTVVKASKGDFIEITEEMLSYRTKADENSKTLSRKASEFWSTFKDELTKDEVISPVFPAPSPEDVLLDDIIGKYVFLKDIEYPGIMFIQGGKQYCFSGSVSNGYYYLDCSSRGFVGAFEALKRAQQIASLELPPQWQVVGRISGVRTLVPRIGKGTEGSTAHLGWVVTPEIIYVPDMVAAQYQADTEKSGFYAGEDQLGKTSTPKTKPLAKEITPEELLQEFVKSAQNQHYEHYLECIAPDRQETGLQKNLMRYYYDIFVENVFESYVAIKVARVEEPELIQGEPEGESIEDLFLDDETKEKLKSSSLPKIEELRIWVQRYNEQGRSVGGQAPVTLRRYESLKNGTPNRWYISFGFPF
tara:strand:- start:1281 stop:2624 length:1344 start_codon:yes stop_codon:yes gene_type:complete